MTWILAHYRSALRTSLLQQIPILLLCSITLDGGELECIGFSAAVGFWVGVIMILLRRHASPQRYDVAFVRWGFLLVFPLSLFILYPMIRFLKYHY